MPAPLRPTSMPASHKPRAVSKAPIAGLARTGDVGELRAIEPTRTGRCARPLWTSIARPPPGGFVQQPPWIGTVRPSPLLSWMQERHGLPSRAGGRLPLVRSRHLTTWARQACDPAEATALVSGAGTDRRAKPWILFTHG